MGDVFRDGFETSFFAPQSAAFVQGKVGGTPIQIATPRQNPRCSETHVENRFYAGEGSMSPSHSDGRIVDHLLSVVFCLFLIAH